MEFGFGEEQEKLRTMARGFLEKDEKGYSYDKISKRAEYCAYVARRYL